MALLIHDMVDSLRKDSRFARRVSFFSSTSVNRRPDRRVDASTGSSVTSSLTLSTTLCSRIDFETTSFRNLFPRRVGAAGVAECDEDNDGARREAVGEDPLLWTEGAGDGCAFLVPRLDIRRVIPRVDATLSSAAGSSSGSAAVSARGSASGSVSTSASGSASGSATVSAGTSSSGSTGAGVGGAGGSSRASGSGSTGVGVAPRLPEHFEAGTPRG